MFGDGGLKVEWDDGPVDPSTGHQWLPGWYVWLRVEKRWEADAALRFGSLTDARRAAYALTHAGLTNFPAMEKAGAEAVIQTAFEALRW